MDGWKPSTSVLFIVLMSCASCNNKRTVRLPTRSCLASGPWQGPLCRKGKMQMLFTNMSKIVSIYLFIYFGKYRNFGYFLYISLYFYIFLNIYLDIYLIFWKCSKTSGCIWKNIYYLIKCTQEILSDVQSGVSEVRVCVCMQNRACYLIFYWII